jgi:hypothetical protein
MVILNFTILIANAVSKRYLTKNKLFGVPAVIVGTCQKAWLFHQLMTVRMAIISDGII